MSNILIESFIGAFPVLKFLPKKLRYYSMLKHEVALPSVINYLEEFQREGITIIPNFLNRETINLMRNNIPSIEKFEESPEGDKALFYRNAHMLPEFQIFFENPLIKSLIRSHIGDKAIPIRQIIEWRRTFGQVLAFDRMFHMDTWKHRVKAFLYLHDVNESDAPLTYLKRSQRGAWRLPMEAKINQHYQINSQGYALNEETAFVGCYWPYEVEQLKRTYGFSELICTGQAGTLIIFDARGLHKANVLYNEYRQVLISYWVHNGHHT